MRRYQRLATMGWAMIWFAGVGCAPANDADAASAASDERAEAAVRMVNVEISPVALTTFTDLIRIAGRIEAYEDVVVSADEGGVLERYFVERGGRVQQGDAVVQLDAEVLRAQVAEAQAAAALAEEQFARRRQLWEVERIGTEIAFLQARYEAEMAAARAANLEARLERTTIRAPISGALEERTLEAGERAGVGDPVFRLVRVNPIKVAGGIPERFAPFIERGDSAVVTFDIFPDREFTGSISFVGRTVNPQNRTFPIEIVIANPDGVIKPEMIANVVVVRTRLDDMVVVPQTAIVRGADGYHIFVVTSTADGLVAAARPVRIGPTSGNQTVILDGLTVGDSLITTGQQLIDAGTRVRIVGATASPMEEEQS